MSSQIENSFRLKQSWTPLCYEKRRKTFKRGLFCTDGLIFPGLILWLLIIPEAGPIEHVLGWIPLSKSDEELDKISTEFALLLISIVNSERTDLALEISSSLSTSSNTFSSGLPYRLTWSNLSDLIYVSTEIYGLIYGSIEK